MLITNVTKAMVCNQKILGTMPKQYLEDMFKKGKKLIDGTASCDVKNVMLRTNSLECNACLLLKRGEQPR